jgi:hypothetical protein
MLPGVSNENLLDDTSTFKRLWLKKPIPACVLIWILASTLDVFGVLARPSQHKFPSSPATSRLACADLPFSLADNFPQSDTIEIESKKARTHRSRAFPSFGIIPKREVIPKTKKPFPKWNNARLRKPFIFYKVRANHLE